MHCASSMNHRDEQRRRATVGQWASRNSRDELAHNEVRIIFSTYFISNLSYYISNIYFEYFELILGLYLVVYIYPIYRWYIFDLFYFEFIVLYIEYIAYFEYFELILGLYLVVYIYPIYRWYIFDLFYFEFIVLYIEYIFWIFRTYFRAVFGRICISVKFHRKLAQKRGVTK